MRTFLRFSRRALCAQVARRGGHAVGTGVRTLLFVAVAVWPCVGSRASPSPDSVEQARKLVVRGEYRDALGLLQSVLKKDRENVSARMTAAAACLGLGSPDCATEHLRWVEKLAPKTPGYQVLRGRVLLLQADLAARNGNVRKQESLSAEAADAFTKAVAEYPGDPTILGLQARALRSANRTAEAHAAFDAWIAADRRNPEAYGAAAAFMADNGTWNQVDALLEQAPTDDPRLLHAIRLEVLRKGCLSVPWETIEPLFDKVDSEENDPTAKKALRAYRSILRREIGQSLLKALDYFDADPADRFGIGRMLDAVPEAKLLYGNGATAESYVEPKLVEKKEPTYPDVARNARIAGQVILLVRIGAGGSIGSVHVMTSTGRLFSDAAADAVRHWRYTPASIRGEPVDVPYILRVDFRIR